MGSDDEFPSASSVMVVARLPSCCAPSISPAAPLFSGKYIFIFVIFSTILISSNSCPRSRLSFWPCEKGLALPPGVGSLISQTRAEFDAYSRAPLLPPAFHDGAEAVCLPLPLVRTVWRVDSAEVATSTPSGALLVDPATGAARGGSRGGNYKGSPWWYFVYIYVLHPCTAVML